VRFLVWCGCITICLSGLELSLYAHDSWRFVWISLLVFYGFAGVVLMAVRAGQLLAGKLGAGVVSRGGKTVGPTLAPRREEAEK